jgi:hypothetical protein
MPRILFDVNIPIGLRAKLPSHDVITAFEMGWNALENGSLMTAAEEAGFSIMVTTDSNIQYQQNLTGRMLASPLPPSRLSPMTMTHRIDTLPHQGASAWPISSSRRPP